MDPVTFTLLSIVGGVLATFGIGAVVYNTNKYPGFNSWIDGLNKKRKDFWNNQFPEESRRRTPTHEEVYKKSQEHLELQAKSHSPTPHMAGTSFTNDSNPQSDTLQNDATRNNIEEPVQPEQNSPATVSPRVYKGNTIGRFFAWFGGTPTKYYDKASDTPNVQMKRSLLGVLAFIVALLSALAIGVDLAARKHSIPIGIVLGTVMFFVISRLEAAFMSAPENSWVDQLAEFPTVKPKLVTKKGALALAGRIGINLTVSILLTIFTLMWLYSTEVDQRIEKKRLATIARTEKAYDDEVDKLEAQKTEKHSGYDTLVARRQRTIEAKRGEISSMALQLKARQDSLIGEIKGYVGTHKPGDKAAAAEDRAALKRDSVYLVSLRADLDSFIAHPDEAIAVALQYSNHEAIALNNQIDALRENEKKAVLIIQKQKMDGLSDCFIAMMEEVATTPFFLLVFLFFMVLDLSCTILKFSFGPDVITHLMALDQQKTLTQNVNRQRKELLVEQLQTETEMGKTLDSIMENRANVVDNIAKKQDKLSKTLLGQYTTMVDTMNSIEEKLNERDDINDQEKKNILGNAKNTFLNNTGDNLSTDTKFLN